MSEENQDPGQAVREMLAEQSTEKALNLMEPERSLTEEERQTKRQASQEFWRSVRRRRKPYWK